MCLVTPLLAVIFHELSKERGCCQQASWGGCDFVRDVLCFNVLFNYTVFILSSLEPISFFFLFLPTELTPSGRRSLLATLSMHLTCTLDIGSDARTGLRHRQHPRNMSFSWESLASNKVGQNAVGIFHLEISQCIEPASFLSVRNLDLIWYNLFLHRILLPYKLTTLRTYFSCT